MTPITPVIPGDFTTPVIYAEHQPEYINLPAHRQTDGTVTTRWRATWRERLRVFLFGDVWLTILTFNAPLQPVKLDAHCPLKLPDDAEDDFSDPNVLTGCS